MQARRRMAALAGSTILALAVVPIATATPAAAETCSREVNLGLTDGSVKITYRVCKQIDNGATQKKLSGTLYDRKTNGYNACATITMGGGVFPTQTFGYSTGSSMPVDTGWVDGNDAKVKLSNC